VFNRIGLAQELLEENGWSQRALLETPQLLNSYSYVANNPLVLADPEGEIIPALPVILMIYGLGELGVSAYDFNNVVIKYPEFTTEGEKAEAYFSLGMDLIVFGVGKLVAPIERLILEGADAISDVGEKILPVVEKLEPPQINIDFESDNESESGQEAGSN